MAIRVARATGPNDKMNASPFGSKLMDVEGQEHKTAPSLPPALRDLKGVVELLQQRLGPAALESAVNEDGNVRSSRPSLLFRLP